MANWHSIDELHDISADLPRFTQAFTELATRLGLEIAPLDADHISLRCHQNATAERWRRGFEQCGELLSENIINGRPICLFKLHEPVTVAHWQFTVVELPWPGEKRYPHEGWEHIDCCQGRKPLVFSVTKSHRKNAFQPIPYAAQIYPQCT